MKIHFVFIIPTFASLLYLTLISIERFVAIKCTFRYMSIVTGLRLKLTIVIVLGSFYVYPIFCKAFLKI